MAQAYEQLHYGTPTCKISAAPILSMKAKFIMLVAALAAAVPVVAANCVNQTTTALIGAENGTTLYACGSAFTVMSAIGLPLTKNNSLVARQCTVPSTTSITQTRVAQSGTWWDDWAQDSGCNYCGLSASTCRRTITWSDTTEASFSVGFDPGTEGTVLDIIKGNAGFNFGYSWGRSYTKGGTWGCDINPGDVARLYIQNQKGWADSQTRYIQQTTNGCGGMSTSYGAWSAYQRSNWALDGQNTINFGCSTGDNAHC